MDSARVTQLSMTAVKGMRVEPVQAITLESHGARGNRAFYVIDDDGRMVNGKDLPTLQSIAAAYDVDAAALALTFPDGSVVSAEIGRGDAVTTRFFSSEREATELDGPWSQALSQYFGRPLRIVDCGRSAVDRGREANASLISEGSLRRLAEIAERDAVDGRRFRMLITVDGVEPHTEDAWVGRRLRIGDAVLRWHGHVGRCVITNRDPDTGITDLMTLKALGRYRRDENSTEPLPFGIYGEILQEATIRVGDPVSLER